MRLDYLATHSQRIEEATLADVQRVARDHLAPAKAAIVILGDASRISDEIAAIVPVQK